MRSRDVIITSPTAGPATNKPYWMPEAGNRTTMNTCRPDLNPESLPSLLPLFVCHLPRIELDVGVSSFSGCKLNHETSGMPFIVRQHKRVLLPAAHHSPLSFPPLCPRTGSYSVRLASLKFGNHSTEQMRSCVHDNRMFQSEGGSRCKLQGKR